MLDQYRVDPIQSVVGNTVLDIIHKENLISNADQVHKHFVKEIHGIMEKHPGIGDVRGAGLLLGKGIMPNVIIASFSYLDLQVLI